MNAFPLKDVDGIDWMAWAFDQIRALASTVAAEDPGGYLPVDCPRCGRHRLHEKDGEAICDKCESTTASMETILRWEES